MKNFLIICFSFFTIGCRCSEPRYTMVTETRTSYYPFASQNIEKIDVSVQFKKEWWKMLENALMFFITGLVLLFFGFTSILGENDVWRN